MVPKKNLPSKYHVWVDARNRFRLSHAHVQMARELGLNPKKLGGLANHGQERWKASLPDFIQDLYWKRFQKEGPDEVFSIEEILKRQLTKKEARKIAGNQAVAPERESDDPF